MFLDYFDFIANTLSASIEGPCVDRLHAPSTLVLEIGVSQVEGLVEPFEVKEPGDALTQDPEVVPEKKTSEDVYRISCASDKQK